MPDRCAFENEIFGAPLGMTRALKVGGGPYLATRREIGWLRGTGMPPRPLNALDIVDGHYRKRRKEGNEMELFSMDNNGGTLPLQITPSQAVEAAVWAGHHPFEKAISYEPDSNGPTVLVIRDGRIVGISEPASRGTQRVFDDSPVALLETLAPVVSDLPERQAVIALKALLPDAF